MEKQNSWTAVIKPEDVVSDLSALVGRWNVTVEVKINNPCQIFEGPIDTNVFDISADEEAFYCVYD